MARKDRKNKTEKTDKKSDTERLISKSVYAKFDKSLSVAVVKDGKYLNIDIAIWGDATGKNKLKVIEFKDEKGNDRAVTGIQMTPKQFKYLLEEVLDEIEETIDEQTS